MALDTHLHARPRAATAQGDLHRQKILAAIRGNPGIHLRRLAHLVGLSWNTCLHHVGVLEARSMVSVRKVAGKVCVFDATRGAVGGKTAACLLRDARNTRVARFVAGHPGAHQRAICAGTDLAPSVVTRRLQSLEEAGLVQRVRDGRVALVQPTPALEAALAHVDDDPLQVSVPVPHEAVVRLADPEELADDPLAPAVDGAGPAPANGQDPLTPAVDASGRLVGAPHL